MDIILSYFNFDQVMGYSCRSFGLHNRAWPMSQLVPLHVLVALHATVKGRFYAGCRQSAEEEHRTAPEQTIPKR
jgi:hypothetical protein